MPMLSQRLQSIKGRLHVVSLARYAEALAANVCLAARRVGPDSACQPPSRLSAVDRVLNVSQLTTSKSDRSIKKLSDSPK